MPSDDDKPKRKWWQFGTRDLFLCTALVATGVAWWVDRRIAADQHSQEIERLEAELKAAAKFEQQLRKYNADLNELNGQLLQRRRELEEQLRTSSALRSGG